MRIELDPPPDSYEAALTEEQRIEFRSLLLSDTTLAELQKTALPWPSGPDQGRKPSITSLFRTRARLRISETAARIEEARIATRATRTLMRRLVKGTNEREVLDEAVALLGRKLIDGCLGLDGTATQMGAAWLLLRRAELRLSEEKMAIFRAQAKSSAQAAEAAKRPTPRPPMDKAEKERRFRQIFGMVPV